MRALTCAAVRVGNALRTLPWVAPLTLLIWVYAERQQERRQTVRFPVQVALTTPDRVVVAPAEAYVTAELRGPSVQLEKVKSRLIQGGDQAVTLSVEQALPPGRHDVRTSGIANDPLFRTNAVSIESIELNCG